MIELLCYAYGAFFYGQRGIEARQHKHPCGGYFGFALAYAVLTLKVAVRLLL